MVDSHPEPHLKLEIYSQPRFLAAVRALLGTLAQRLGFDDMQCGQISLAVDEALCNIINHGYGKRPDGRIWLAVWIADHHPAGLKIVIEDRARQVEPHTIQPRDLEDIRPGGLGVYIIREVMDEVRYEKRDGGGMRLTMTRRVDSRKNTRAAGAAAPTSPGPARTAKPTSYPGGKMS
jgi:anti-sigma regulatory factor (Ser/Thr protein kinase)